MCSSHSTPPFASVWYRFQRLDLPILRPFKRCRLSASYSVPILAGVGVAVLGLLPDCYPAAFALSVSQEQASHPVWISSSVSQDPEIPSVEDLVVLFKRDQPPLGSRTRYCAISPGIVGDRDQVWNDRPLFLWKGQAEQLVVQDFYSDAMVWSQDIDQVESSMGAIAYAGPALQPDQLYRWQLIQNGAVATRGLFSVMGGDRRSEIEVALNRLHQELVAAQASEATITLKKAEFLGNQGLWSDAFALLYAYSRTEGQMVIEQMADHLCGDMSTTQGAIL